MEWGNKSSILVIWSLTLSPSSICKVRYLLPRYNKVEKPAIPIGY